MVYKIGNINDLVALPPMEAGTMELLYHYAKVLSTEYGEQRDINSDGGYVLYATPYTTTEEIKAYFDYARCKAECVEQYGNLCTAMYLLNNEYAVIIVARTDDMPIEILKELDEE